MSLSVSPEVEARIVAQANAEGISVDEYLQDLVSTNEEFVTAMRRLNASFDPLSREAAPTKITRGLEELARGEYADGEWTLVTPSAVLLQVPRGGNGESDLPPQVRRQEVTGGRPRRRPARL